MTIALDRIAKRFSKEWIFRNVNLTIEKGQSLAITGPNGSGKSTLLQIISGNLIPSEGELNYQYGNKKIDQDDIFSCIAIAAPYLDIVEEFTLEEFLRFHFGFKPMISGFKLEELPALFQLEHAVKKPIKNFSTGMRQRVKLGICFYSDVPVLLLDEPTSNLDSKGVKWYHEQIERLQGQKRILVISSNNENEYAFCDRQLNIMDYKS